jgi:hypothetical protein
VAQGEFCHGFLKKVYGRTNKKDFQGQLTTYEGRFRVVRACLGQRLKRKRIYKKASLKRKRTRSVHRKGSAPATLPHNADEPLPYSKPREHFHISEQTRYPVKISQFLEKNDNDVATHVRNVVIR